MNRIKELDFVRAFAALSVVVIHVTGPYVTVNRYGYIMNQGARFAVPIFVIISGLLLMYSYSGKEFKTGIFLRKRFNKILIPYLIWTLIYVLFNYRNDIGTLMRQKSQFASLLLQKLKFGTADSHLYFIIIMIQLYILFPVLKKLVEKAPKVTLWVSFIITLLFHTGVYLSLLHKVTLPGFVIPYYEFFPTWIFFFVFGMYFCQRFSVLTEKIRKGRIILIPVWFVSLMLLIADSRLTNTYGSSVRPSIVLYCITTFLFMYAVLASFRNINGTFMSIVEEISRQSFIMYFSHILIIKIIKMVSNHLGLAGLWDRTVGMVFLLAVVVIATLFFSYIVSLTPFAGALGGVPKCRNIRRNKDLSGNTLSRNM